MKSKIRKLLAISIVLCFIGGGLVFTTFKNPPEAELSKMLAGSSDIKFPIAEIVPHEMEIHGHTRIDNYYWLRDDSRQDPEMLAYLEAENAYIDAIMEPTQAFQEVLFEELIGRIKEDDSSVPYKYMDFWYYSRYEKDKEYPIYCRKEGNLEAPEQIILDVNQLAEPYEFYRVGSMAVSSRQDILAFAEDAVSRRQYHIRFKNLKTGELYPDDIDNASPAIAWANDNKSLFYVKKHPETLLGYQVYRHVLGTDPADDVLVYEEPDDTFYTYIYKSKSRDYIVLGLAQTLSTEIRLLDANNPEGKFQVFLPREQDHEYSIVHDGSRFLILTNWQAQNFRLMETPIDKIGDKSSWNELIPNREDVLIEEVEAFANHLVVAERNKGLLQLRIMDKRQGTDGYMDFGEPAYTAYIHKNPEYDTNLLRYGYSSLTTPDSIYEYDMTTGKKVLLKQSEVLGGFDSANYASERLYVPARDGESIPVSLVYRKNYTRDGTHPLYLEGYGAYGYSIDPSFSSHILSLLDRGFVYAIAHVRGGQEMGRRWYEDGKMFNKMNTFTDYIDVTKFLVEEGYAAPDKVFAMGGSAGGLLMGAVVNMRPDLYRGVIALVPFVDLVTTMLDESIPLTTGEFDEWGNPKNKDSYEYMLSYSPYDQVKAQDYPPMLVTTGLWDSQVQYWEPTKWVAKLRATKTDDNLLLLHINMDVGHGGASGRFRWYEMKAMEYAFIFDLLGISE